MKPDDIKAQLDASTLRPQDATEAARARLEQDGSLRSWVEDRQKFDEKVADAMAGIPVPAGAQAMLLKAVAEERHKHKVRRTALFMGGAIAVSTLMVVLGFFLLQSNDATKPGHWESQALAMVKQIDHGQMRLDHFSGDIQLLKDQLSQAGAPVPGLLPESVKALRSLGCKTITLAGLPASVICFELRPGMEAHLVIQEYTEVEQVDTKPAYRQSNNWNLAEWKADGRRYLLASRASTEELRQLFALAQRQVNNAIALV